MTTTGYARIIGFAGALFLTAALFLLPAAGMAGNIQWTTNGPGGATIKALAYANDHTIFAGSSNAGVFKSTDGGTTWSQANDGLTNTVTSLVISPNFATDQTIFAGTAGTFVGVYKSTNGGASWSPVSNGITGATNSMAISPNYAIDQTVFAWTHDMHRIATLYKTTDGGATWTESSLSVYYGFPTTDLAISPSYAQDQTVFAITRGSDNFYKSIDGGTTWSQVNIGISTFFWDLVISPDFASDQTIFAGAGDGIYKSTDGGASWSGAYTGFPVNAMDVGVLAISPDFATDQTVFASISLNGFFESTDGGASWIKIDDGLSTDTITSLAVSPDFANDKTIFAGTGNGVYSYTIIGPAVTDVQPSGTIDAKSTAVTISYFDRGSAINTDSVIVKLDGMTLTGCTVTTTGASCPTSRLSKGSHTIIGSVADNAGNTTSFSGSFTIGKDKIKKDPTLP